MGNCNSEINKSKSYKSDNYNILNDLAYNPIKSNRFIIKKQNLKNKY